MNTDRLIELIEAGANVEVNADRSTDNLIRIGKAIRAQGRTPRFLNCSGVSSDNLLRIHRALEGDVILSGI